MKREKQLYKKNLKRQLKLKSGENPDCFSFNEPGVNDDLSNCENLLEFDRKDWEFQKAHQTDTFSEEYSDQLYLPGMWFRAVEYIFDDKKPFLVYGQLESLESWLANTVYEKLLEAVDKKIPNKIVRDYTSPIFEKIPDSEFLRWNPGETRANGREEELQALKKKCAVLYVQLRHRAREIAKQYSGCLFRKYLNSNDPYALEMFIVGGQDAAVNIRFKTFLTDVYKLEQPYGLIKKEKKKLFKEFKQLLFTKTARKALRFSHRDERA